MKALQRALLTIGLIMVPTTVLADFKVATVDMGRILNESRESQKAKQQLDKLSTEARQRVDAKRSQLEKTEELIRSGKLTIESKEGQKFQEDMRDFNQMVRKTEEELREEFMKSNTKVTEGALTIIQGYAKQNKIDLVLDKSSTSRGPVVYGVADFDITDEVVRLLR